MNDVKEVVLFLHNLNIPIKDVCHFSEFDDVADGSVDLVDGRHIQIGADYFMVYAKPFHPEVLGRLIAEIDGTNLADLREALMKGGE